MGKNWQKTEKWANGWQNGKKIFIESGFYWPNLATPNINEQLPLRTEIGALASEDEDDTVFEYSLVSGLGSTDNNLFVIPGAISNIFTMIAVWNSSTNYQLLKIKQKKPLFLNFSNACRCSSSVISKK